MCIRDSVRVSLAELEFRARRQVEHEIRLHLGERLAQRRAIADVEQLDPRFVLILVGGEDRLVSGGKVRKHGIAEHAAGTRYQDTICVHRLFSKKGLTWPRAPDARIPISPMAPARGRTFCVRGSKARAAVALL